MKGADQEAQGGESAALMAGTTAEGQDGGDWKGGRGREGGNENVCVSEG